jgi:hypothetical protein
VRCEQHVTARKALEYAMTTRANSQSQRNLKKVQEFLLQVGKILTELRKQEEQNNTGYAE